MTEADLTKVLRIATKMQETAEKALAAMAASEGPFKVLLIRLRLLSRQMDRALAGQGPGGDKNNLVRPKHPPRYDDVYFEGLAQLDALALEDDDHE